MLVYCYCHYHHRCILGDDNDNNSNGIDDKDFCCCRCCCCVVFIIIFLAASSLSTVFDKVISQTRFYSEGICGRCSGYHVVTRDNRMWVSVSALNILNDSVVTDDP